MMKSSLLLILSLITGCEFLSKVTTCKEDWIQFTCRKTKPCTMARPPKKENALILTIDTNPSSARQEQEFEVEKNGCPKPFYQNVTKSDKTTIRCFYPGKYKSYFFCKQSNSSCKDVLSSGKSHQRSKFRDTKTDKGFEVSISDVSSQDAGVYWCGIKTSTKYKFSLKQVQLKVIANFTRSPVIGQNFSYWCKYDDDSSLTKFICKGDDPSMCQLLANTTNTEMDTKFSMNDDQTKRNISITVREVTVKDSGTYWCGAEGANKQRFFIHKLFLSVVSPTPIPAAAVTHGVISVIICAAVLPSLLLLMALILICKRFPCSKTTGNPTQEDFIYEEIDERVQPPEAAPNTIYVTANAQSHAAPAHFTTINIQDSDKAGGEALEPTSSASQYSTVKFTEQLECHSTTPDDRGAAEKTKRRSALRGVEQI